MLWGGCDQTKEETYRLAVAFRFSAEGQLPKRLTLNSLGRTAVIQK
jgi:hypothetical protein